MFPEIALFKFTAYAPVEQFYYAVEHFYFVISV